MPVGSTKSGMRYVIVSLSASHGQSRIFGNDILQFLYAHVSVMPFQICLSVRIPCILCFKSCAIKFTCGTYSYIVLIPFFCSWYSILKRGSSVDNRYVLRQGNNRPCIYQFSAMQVCCNKFMIIRVSSFSRYISKYHRQLWFQWCPSSLPVSNIQSTWPARLEFVVTSITLNSVKLCVLPFGLFNLRGYLI